MRSLALQRQPFTSNEQYLEACADLAEQKRRDLAQLFASDGDTEAKCVFASTLLRTWGEEHDALWERRVSDAQRKMNP